MIRSQIIFVSGAELRAVVVEARRFDVSVLLSFAGGRFHSPIAVTILINKSEIMAAPVKFYYDLLSPPSRALLTFFKMANIPIEEKAVALRKRKRKTFRKTKSNDLHC